MITLVKIIGSFVLSVSVSLVVLIATLFLFAALVKTFRLNNGVDAYWVFSLTTIITIISWISSFMYFLLL
jgi:hypothetical protein